MSGMSGRGTATETTRDERRAAAEALLDLGLNPTTLSKECPDKAGDLIGRYRLVDRVGEGGFGVVWAARQEVPIRRDIALKLIKRGMDSCEIIARFEAESQALARMDHPNIAAVLDAGTTPDGRPYFAMELVRGEPLNSYCDSRNLSIRQRLELFIPVCLAVQHAHQKAILHRDLKPSNILVTEVDGKPVPKVIDFGIAKALGAPDEATLQDSLLQTRAGAVVGTLQYMSPEQAGSVLDVDTRSDVYSLGVILYELLVGNTPLRPEATPGATRDEILRRIREEDPAKPSSKATSEHAATRNTDGRRLKRQLRGELDWIVLKALEKDRRRRYETATALATDLRRFLNEEPVSAAAPTWGYQASKFARRHRVGLAIAGIIFAALASATAVSLWQTSEAKKAKEIADRNRIESEKNARRAADAVEVYLNKVTTQSRLQGEEFRELRRDLLESALPFYEAMVASDSGDLQLRINRRVALERIGTIYDDIGELEKSIAARRAALAAQEALGAELPRDNEYNSTLANCANDLATSLRKAGRGAESAEVQKRAVAIWRGIAAASKGDYDMHLAKGLLNLADSLSSAGDHAGSAEAALGAIDFLRASMRGSSREELAMIYEAVGVMLGRLPGKEGATEESLLLAITLRKELTSVPNPSPDALGALAGAEHRLSRYLLAWKRSAEALDYAQRAVADYQRMRLVSAGTANSRHYVAITMVSVGECLTALKRFQDAESILQEALGMKRQLITEFPANSGHVGDESRVLFNLARVRESAADYRGAADIFRACAASYARARSLNRLNAEWETGLRSASSSLAAMCEKAEDPAALVATGLEYRRQFPKSWQEQEKAAGWIATAVPLFAKCADLAEDERNKGAESAKTEAISALKASIELGNPRGSELREDPRFRMIITHPQFAQLEDSAPDPVDRSPSRFGYNYSLDDPGKRVWKRDGNAWQETQPSGKNNRFNITRRLRVDKVSGTEIEAIGRRLWLFIPDKSTPPQTELKYRVAPGEWRTLGTMVEIE